MSTVHEIITGLAWAKVDLEAPNYDASGFDLEVDRAEANVSTSLHRGTRNGSRAHALLLDIDIEAWLVPSSTPGHSHLYVDLVTDWDKLKRFLDAALEIGLIQPGFHRAACDRGFTSLRLPWVRKDQPVENRIMAQQDWEQVDDLGL
jgi:hypothetical protein